MFHDLARSDPDGKAWLAKRGLSENNKPAQLGT
jgi:hypothetical protein